MARNPNPDRIPGALWYFGEQCVAMQPGTQNGGLYAPKYQYHDTRDHIISAGRTNDYSVRFADDKAGPGDKCAAFDWTFPDAQSGRYGTIVKYGTRVAMAYAARDPRLHGWREVLVQADYDEYAEGFDFVTWSTRTPDNSHLWHAHFSCLRRYVNDMAVMNGMLSILAGEPYDVWASGRSYYGGDPSKQNGDEGMFIVEWQETGKSGSSWWLSNGLEYRTFQRWENVERFRSRGVQTITISGDKAAFEDLAGRPA